MKLDELAPPIVPQWMPSASSVSISAFTAEILLELSGRLGWHAVRRGVAAGQLERNTQGRATGAGTAGESPFAPVVADRHHVETHDSLLAQIVAHITQ